MLLCNSQRKSFYPKLLSMEGSAQLCGWIPIGWLPIETYLTAAKECAINDCASRGYYMSTCTLACIHEMNSACKNDRSFCLHKH